MKKLMISLLLVLGMYQTTTPMFAAAKAAMAARASTPFMQYMVAPAVFGTVGAYLGNLPQLHQLQAMNAVFANPSFQANNGMIEHGWLRTAWETTKWLYSEVGAGIGIAGLLMGGASTAHSLVAKESAQETQQVAAQSGAVAAPGARAQFVITPAMREARHKRNREMLAKAGYNPLVVRAS